MFEEIKIDQQENIPKSSLLSKRFSQAVRVMEKLRVVLAISLVLSLFPTVSLQAASPGSAPNISQKTGNSQLTSPANIFYIDQINVLRSKLGKDQLKYNSALEKSASLKARDMIANGYWGHVSPNKQSFSDFIWRQSPSSEKVGENLARCFIARDSAFKALQASPTHYEIMIGDFTDVGVSEIINVNDSCVYAVFHFAKN